MRRGSVWHECARSQEAQRNQPTIAQRQRRRRAQREGGGMNSGGEGAAAEWRSTARWPSAAWSRRRCPALRLQLRARAPLRLRRRAERPGSAPRSHCPATETGTEERRPLTRRRDGRAAPVVRARAQGVPRRARSRVHRWRWRWAGRPEWCRPGTPPKCRRRTGQEMPLPLPVRPQWRQQAGGQWAQRWEWAQQMAAHS